MENLLSKPKPVNRKSFGFGVCNLMRCSGSPWSLGYVYLSESFLVYRLCHIRFPLTFYCSDSQGFTLELRVYLSLRLSSSLETMIH